MCLQTDSEIGSFGFVFLALLFRILTVRCHHECDTLEVKPYNSFHEAAPKKPHKICIL